MDVESTFDLSGKNGIVTGSSAGIGRTIAERFVEAGTTVTLCSREMDRVGPAAKSINESHGGDTDPALAVECDVTDPEAIDEMIRRAVEEYGELDFLVNNAGASFMAPLDEISPNGWRRVVDINLTSIFLCTRAALDSLSTGGGTIVNISSIAGIKGGPAMPHYSAAKAGVINYTMNMAPFFSRQGIRMNCIAPGFVATRGLESQMGVEARSIDRGIVNRDIGLKEEIADVVHFLCSPASSFVNGETISAQGVPPEMHEQPQNLPDDE